ncbi:MAG: AmmeMemoRadiSam system radical SAM enzyme [Chloroflexi bacterium]|nr:AmmeMemoRadiSam system radical SAM enzyme [Chloroflexota bacterium]MCL5275499.1 AmmeMemoRadiSam system radical SAM enzyme [Chloroflexota bacterium]
MNTLNGTRLDAPAVRKPIAGDVPLSSAIDPLVKEGTLYERLPDDAVHCFACGHHCRIKPGARGICQVRYNAGGTLYVPWGYVSSLNCDPIEKKPFYHVLPGSDVMTFGMLGCDMHCTYCQNWDISQALRDGNAEGQPSRITAEQIVHLAGQYGARGVASSYNEPLITSEWAMSIFKPAKAAGFVCMFVSNGNTTREALEFIRPWTDAYKIDLKTMRDASYRSLGAVLERVLDGVRMVYALGFWLEIVTLVVPGFNDSDDELRDAARFIKSVSPDIPWHVTAFHQDYKMRQADNTGARTLMRAAEIGYGEGLRYVYAGNLPGRSGSYENTACPGCGRALIERRGFRVLSNHVTQVGDCPHCHTAIAGIWRAPQT